MIKPNHSRNLAVRLRAGQFVAVLMLGGLLTICVPAQTFTTLHSFTTSSTNSSGVYTNSDGANPYAGLILSGNTLYGTAQQGGSFGFGAVFAVNTDGTGFTNLHNFTDGFLNSDGANPHAGLILSGNTLYGTTSGGGAWGNGTVFAINADGTGFTNLHSFTATSGPYPSTNSDGRYPVAGLVLSDVTLYGTTVGGGGWGDGTVFRLNIDGTAFTNLHSFFGSSEEGSRAGLILSDSTLYGAAYVDGSAGHGAVFAINTDGTGFTNLYSFPALSDCFTGLCTNTDGALPPAGLVLSGSTLYGTAAFGGSSGSGTVFKVNTNGTGFTTLHSFTRSHDNDNVSAGLISSGNVLYGTTSEGGSVNGSVFVVNTDGTDFTDLYSFTPGGYNFSSALTNSDGAAPYAGLVLSGNTLYGTAVIGGSWGNGTIFSLSFTPQLTITASGASVILTWPTNYAGFDYTGYTLQSTTNLASSIWVTNLPAPVVVGGRDTVTNPISGTQQFFRLSQ